MDEDRAYILRYRPEGADEDEYFPIADFDLETYRCGLKAEDRVRLMHRLEIFDENGIPSGELHEIGEIWTVLTGSSQDPEVHRLRQANGELHGWDDDPEIFETFEKIEHEA